MLTAMSHMRGSRGGVEASDKGSLPTWLVRGVWRVGRRARKCKMDLGVARDQETCMEAVGGGAKAYRRHRGAVVTTGLAHRSTAQPRSPSRDTGDGGHDTLSPHAAPREAGVTSMDPVTGS